VGTAVGIRPGKGRWNSAVERGGILCIGFVSRLQIRPNLDELIAYAAAMEGLELTPSKQARSNGSLNHTLPATFFRRIAGGKGSWEIYREKDFLLPVGLFLNGLGRPRFLVSPAGLWKLWTSNPISISQGTGAGGWETVIWGPTAPVCLGQLPQTFWRSWCSVPRALFPHSQ